MMANPADAVKQRAVRFDTPRNQSGRGKSKIIERRSHYLTFVGRAGSESLKGTELAEKLNKPAPQITRREYE